MKELLSILLVFIMLSCNNTKETESTPQISTVEVIDLPLPSEYYTDFSDNICQMQMDSARADVKNGKLIYANYSSDFKYTDEIKELLNKKGIGYSTLGENCTRELNCYGYYMDSIMNLKYGKDFIKRTKTEAKTLSDSRWKTKIYNFQEVDKSAVLIDEHGLPIKSADSYSLALLLIPNGWDYTTKFNEREYISVSLVIDKNGKSSIDSDSFDYNLKNRNIQFTTYLKKDIERVAKLMYWKPAEMNGHKVKSREYIDITLN